MRTSALAPLLALAVGLPACYDDTPFVAPPPEPPLAEGCNPLGGAADEDCFLPFPSSYFTTEDATTATGLRVALPPSLLPANTQGAHFDPSLLNRLDGASAATTLIAYFPSRVDPADLPGPDRIADSTSPTSAVQLLRFDTGERVPLFAEIDANAKPDERQALLIRPVIRLAPATRYVAVVQKLHRIDGSALPPLSGFGALRDGATRAGSVRRGLAPRYEEIFQALASAGITRGDLQLAWDFTTASDEPIQGRLVKMRDEAFAYKGSGAPPPPVTFTTVDESPADMPELRRRIVGTFTAPSFLTADDDGGAGLNLDAQGEPVIRDYGQFPLAIHVPACAEKATLPLPVVIYGHGSYNSAANEMATEYQRSIINRLCVVEVGSDWLGRAAGDTAFFLQNVLMDASQIHVPTERLHQAQVNFIMLARLLKSGALKGLPELTLGGKPLLDTSRVYYYGISEGGIQGATFMALTPDIDRGALNVPCGFWSMFFWRSSDFHPILPFLRIEYPEALDLQVLMGLTQPLWDYTDPATYAPHLLHDPLPGSMPKKILYQEGINDASVPNQTTRAMVRTMGIPLLSPPFESVPGVTEQEGPLDSGYAQFDIGSMPRIGGDNVPPPTSDVHETIRLLEPVQQQLQLFLREGGKVENTCGGKPCAGLSP